MRKINIITSNPSQTMFLKLDNGQSINFSLSYSYNQRGWFYKFTYGNYKINNKRVVHSINMLRGIKNIIPFGLACLLTDKYEPVFIDDFANGRATIYILNQDDVAEAESLLNG